MPSRGEHKRLRVQCWKILTGDNTKTEDARDGRLGIPRRLPYACPCVWHLLEIADLNVEPSVIHRNRVDDERSPMCILTLGFQVDQRGIKLDRSGGQILLDEMHAGRCESVIQYDLLCLTPTLHTWCLGENLDWQARSEDPLRWEHR